MIYRAFSLTWPAHMQIYRNKRKCLQKKRVQLPEDWFGTPAWPPFHCFGTPIWLPWRHVKTLYCTESIELVITQQTIVQACAKYLPLMHSDRSWSNGWITIMTMWRNRHDDHHVKGRQCPDSFAKTWVEFTYLSSGLGTFCNNRTEADQSKSETFFWYR